MHVSVLLAGAPSDHTYAHGEASDSQANKSEAGSSVPSDVEVVQYIYANNSKELLKKIVEENESKEKDDSDENDVRITEGVYTNIDVSMEQTERIIQSVGFTGVTMEAEEVSEILGIIDTAEVSDPLNKTFDEGEIETVESVVEPKAVSESSLDSLKKSASVLSNETFPTDGQRNVQTDQSLQQDLSSDRNVEMGQRLQQDSNFKSVDEQMKQINASIVSVEKVRLERMEVNEKSTSIATKAVDDVSERSELSNSMVMKTADANEHVESAIVKESTQDRMMNDLSEIQTEESNKVNDRSMKHFTEAIENKDVSMQPTDHCNNTAQDTFEHKSKYLPTL